MERVMHRMVGLFLVDEPDLDLVADPESPVDGGVLGTGLPIDHQPAHVRRRRLAVDLDHVVFPFDAVRATVRMPSVFVLLVLPMVLFVPVMLLMTVVLLLALTVAMAVVVVFVAVHVMLLVGALA